MKSLRQRALDILDANESVNIDSVDIKEVIHELNVNQIELELQNHDLRDQEHVLLEAQEELMLLFMNAPIGYLVLDEQFHIHRYNKHAYDIFQFLERRVKIYFFSFFKNMDKMNKFIKWTKVNDGSSFELEIYNIKKIPKWLKLTHETTKLNNKKMHLLSVVDITKEKEEKEKLYLYDSILEKLPVSIIITDVDGYITYVNKELLNCMEYENNELIGVRPSVFRSQSITQSKYDEIWETISSGKTWTGILKNLTKSKKTAWMAVAISPIFDDKNKIINYIAVETNIDEKINMEEKLKKQEDIMLVQARHAAMGEMISIIAHQWRQPLSVISTAATGIKMQKEFDTVLELEDEIKSLDAINESAQLNSETLRNNNIEFKIDIPSNTEIHTYENELLQVLINLINNAKDVLIEKKDLIAKPLICVKIYDKDKDLILEVNDNAGGVPEAIMDRIFEPYFTTKGPASGTGLGLYITKTIVDKHLQGTINVSNNEKGASFEIVIPNLDKRNETD